MKMPFEYFVVKPNGWGQGHFTVLVYPRLGFLESLRCPAEIYPTPVQQKFIEDAIREKMERDQ